MWALQVAFVDGDRLLGEEAAALAVRYPDRVYARHAQSLFQHYCVPCGITTHSKGCHCITPPSDQLHRASLRPVTGGTFFMDLTSLPVSEMGG